MSARDVQLWITVDQPAGLALLRGSEARYIARLFDGRWSRSGRGWVIAAGLVADIRAYCEYYRVLAVTHQRKAVE